MLKGLSRAKNPAKETVAEWQYRAEREARGQVSWKTGIHSSREPRGEARGIPVSKQNKRLAPSPQDMGVDAKGCCPSRTALLPLRCAPGAPSLRAGPPSCVGRPEGSACLVGFQAKPTNRAEDHAQVLRVQPPKP